MAGTQQPLASSLLFGSQRKIEEGATIPLAKGLIPLGSAPSSPMPPECQAAVDVRWQRPGCQGLKESKEPLLCHGILEKATVIPKCPDVPPAKRGCPDISCSFLHPPPEIQRDKNQSLEEGREELFLEAFLLKIV